MLAEGPVPGGPWIMASRPRRTTPAALLGVLGVLLGPLVVGCGGDPGPAPSSTASSTVNSTDTSTDSSTASAGETSTDLDRFLLEADEISGLVPMSSPFTHAEEPFELSEEGAALLERVGYVSTTYQPAQGDRQAGVSSVLLFDTPAGARDWMAYEMSDEALEQQLPESRIERFEVPGVPGAGGWTAPDLHGSAIGTVYWTQGRCMMVISLEVEGPRAEPLSTGSAAVHERTGGTCPG